MDARILNELTGHIDDRDLSEFYPDSTDLNPYVQQALTLISELGAQISGELAPSLGLLTLYDLALLIDDSSSMEFEDSGDRKISLKQVLRAISRIYFPTQANDEIRAIKFLNGTKHDLNRATKQRMDNVLNGHRYFGSTMIGTQLKRKILTPLVNDHMSRPLLVVVITDGQVDGETNNALQLAIEECIGALPHNRKHSVAFQFSRVGGDPGAIQLLDGLDKLQNLERHIDTQPANMNFYPEGDPEDSPFIEKVAKLMLGALMDSWDAKGE